MTTHRVPKSLRPTRALRSVLLALVAAAAIAAAVPGTARAGDVLNDAFLTVREGNQADDKIGFAVSTAGDVNLCHRFAGSDDHKLGTVHDGIDREAQRAFLDAHHVDRKTDCQTCWARPLCAGGCYHEAHTREGSTVRPNLHYCEWIRGWTDTCLRIYGEIAARNPAFLHEFEGATHEAPQPA